MTTLEIIEGESNLVEGIKMEPLFQTREDYQKFREDFIAHMRKFEEESAKRNYEIGIGK